MSLRRNITLLYFINFFTDCIFFAPVAILYFSRVAGSFALGMSIFSIVTLSSAFLEIPTGIFSDFIGRKRTMILGSTFALLSTILYAIGGSYAMLVVGALLFGLSQSLYSGNNDAFLYETVDSFGEKDKYPEYSGKLSSMFQFGLAFSAIVGGFLVFHSYALLLWASVLPQMIVLALTFFLIEPRKHNRESTNVFSHLHISLHHIFSSAKLRNLTIVQSIRFAVGESAFRFRAAFVVTLWPVWAIGISNALSHIGAATGYLFSGKLLKRFGAYRLLSLEIVCNRIINFISLLYPTVASPALMGLTSISYGTGQVAIGGLLQKNYTDKQRATLGSVVSFFGSILFGITSVSLGFVADHIGPVYTLVLVNIILLTPLYFYKKIFVRK